ncbi:chloride channel protein [Clostridium sp.]|uniref:chloride channel protein n=1 Tax=Clostridium sp. TaxID=1506 RepID=UPI003F332A98
MSKTRVIKLVVISGIIGGLSGVIIGIFLIVLEKAIELNLEQYWLIVFLPLSGLLMTFLYKKYGKNSKRGNNLIIENINGNEEKIHFIMAPLVFMGTVLTHIFGGSVGREGTGVQIGGTIGNSLANIFKKTDLDRKILLISGVSAGFSAVFGTPIAGTIFAVEISTVGNLNYASMLPAVTAAIIGDKVARLVGVTHTHFQIPQIESFAGMNIEKVIILSICFGLISKLFVYMIHLVKDIFNKYIKNDYIKILIGGSIMVGITFLLGNRVYNNLSLGLLMDSFDGNAPYFAFLIKLLLTTLCLGVGYQGGEVTPLFVIGATLGATLSPILGLPVTFAAALGLIGVFAGATNAPIASFVLYLELFGSNDMIFAMIVCIISVFISGKKGIYSSQVWLEY